MQRKFFGELAACKREYLIPAAVVLSFLGSCVIHSSKHFWMDEIVSYQLISDQSFFHMLRAMGDGAEVAPPLYFMVGWFWKHLFGADEYSLRLLSCLLICSTALITWFVLRRSFSNLAAGIGLSAAFGLSAMVINQNAEARFYGMLLFFTALALRQFIILTQDSAISKSLILNAIAHAGLVLTHTSGVIYSFVFLLSFIARDVTAKKFHPGFYLSVLAGWVVYTPWIPSLLRQADNLKAHIWIPVPSSSDLVDSLAHGLPIAIIIIILVLLGVLKKETDTHTIETMETSSHENVHKSRGTLVFVGLMLTVFVPVLTYLVSVYFKSIFLDRYMIAGVLGWAILLSFAAEKLGAVSSRIASSEPLSFKVRDWRYALPFWVALLFASAPMVGMIYYHRYDLLLAGPRHIEIKLPDLPIVAESPQTFLPNNHYDHSRKYYYILDWETALKSPNLHETSDNKLMAAWKRNYAFDNILTSDEFLARFDKFLVLDESDRLWSQARLRENPNYRCVDMKGSYVLVERISTKPQVGIAPESDSGNAADANH